MRILLLAPQPFFQERGTPIAVRMLAQAMVESGHEVDLLTYHLGDDVEIPGCRIFRIPRIALIRKVPIGFSFAKLVCDGFLLFSLIKRVGKEKYDVVHAVEESAFFALLTRRLHRARVVYDMDSSMPDQLIEKWPFLRSIAAPLYGLEKWLLRRADRVVPVCQVLVQRAKLEKSADRVILLEDFALALPGESGVPVDDVRASRRIQGLIAMYVGNLETYQGIDLLLDGFSKISSQTPLDLVLIGGGEGEINRYQSKARALGIGSRCHFLGPRPVSQLAEYLVQADMLLSPRLKGINTPMKIFTYLASAKPILATDILSHTQVLDQDTSCLVAPDSEAMASGLLALSTDEGLRKRIGINGQNLATTRYSYERFYATVSRLYSDLDSLGDR